MKLKRNVGGKQHLAVFASGTGSNAQKIIDHFNSADRGAKVVLIVCNKPGAGVSIWFQCRDSLLLYHEFLDNGIKADEPFVGNGLWDVRVVDPDGYNVHFECQTDVEEETRYSAWRKGSLH